MLNSTIQIKVTERLNKLSSQDYDNIECWQIVEAFNKGMIDWCRMKLSPLTQISGDEQSKRLIDDLQVLLTTDSLTLTDRGDYYESEIIPSNYLEFKRLDINASKECCKDSKKMMVYLAEESNVTALLRDDLKKPNFEWAETFCTIIGNRIRIYTNNEFNLSDCVLTYYRNPRQIQIEFCVNPYTGSISTSNVTCEFKDDITEVLVDKAASIIAGDIESLTQYQRLTSNPS